MDKANFSEWLQETAREIGAHSVGCVRMDNPELRRCIEENHALVAGWLAAGKHGEMDYLQRMHPAKADPWTTFPRAKSVIVLTFANHWGDAEAAHPFPRPASDALIGYVSAYARGTDYHYRGQAMLAELAKQLGLECWTEAAVDTKAVYERIFASVAGLGARGGNDLLRVPDRNVRVFIGCLFVERELPELIHELRMPFSCHDCQACIRQCPTGAIRFGEPIDAPRCISYLTIEKRGVLTRHESELIGSWLFGCDECTVACPPRDRIDARIPVDLEWLLKTPAAEIGRILKGNAAAYAGVARLRRNAVAMLKTLDSPRASDLLEWVEKESGSELVLAQLAAW